MSVFLDEDFDIDEVTFKNLDGFKNLLNYIQTIEIPKENKTTTFADVTISTNKQVKRSKYVCLFSGGIDAKSILNTNAAA